ncbi:MAG: hypothetical protein LH702_09820 [Phormidesmis sp. CAN_BIN44]|nr:hypothetical protein [Phormidesmis sp. CAN_BIN44]
MFSFSTIGSDLQDDRQLKVAAQQVRAYVSELKALESQIGQNGTAEREFAATLKRQQGIATTQLDITRQQRKASLAAERGGASQSLRDSGRQVLDQFADPLASALELQKSLAGVQKLASDISDQGFKSLGNQVFTLSSDMGIANTEVAKVLEDLAGSGKRFTDAIDPTTNKSFLSARISETEQILKNKSALDVTTDAATQLDVTLGFIYKQSLPNYQGGIVELNARTASSVNELADKLEDVKISADDVLPTVKVVLNTIGDKKNFPIDQIAAYSAAISSLGTIEPEAAGSFINRLNTTMSDPKMTKVFAQKLGYGSTAEFDKELNADHLTVIQKIAESYKNVKGGQLQQGGFLSSLGINSAQDQKLIQGLANQLDVLKDARKVARAGFQGVDQQGNAVAELSINAELGRTMQTSAFQTERFQQSIKSLKDSLASLALEALTPVIGMLGEGIGLVLKISQQFPGLAKGVCQ